ncbi:hypothetical protein DBR37_12905 [Herminiimonas sp. KBW02]|uniref:hypothetical protein n=1 Tax=Herminiimonas sp. KBW02 TaxID=2153363 RepID=UPI000F5B7E95|nr:hypothetical protein [Herminiimonas sp. KBW02]RQO34012.1 hypothetical protein DBR37_12905 [Herminiimonas sp. KBW02]
MKKLLSYVVMTFAIAASGAVLAHGDKPKHGGITSSASDLAFELVNKEGQATLYVEDHGQEVSTAGAVAKLTVLNGTEKTEVALEPAPYNMLISKGDAKLKKGSKVVASITFADKSTANVRFSLK